MLRIQIDSDLQAILMARISQIRVGSGGEYQYIYEDTRRAVTFPNPMTQRFQLDHGFRKTFCTCESSWMLYNCRAPARTSCMQDIVCTYLGVLRYAENV